MTKNDTAVIFFVLKGVIENNQPESGTTSWSVSQ